jgi:YD repeat-containing protein
VRADDSLGRSVHYTYDEIGRLAKVQTATGEVFTYKYDSQNRMTGAQEGSDRVLNAYNGDRCIHQIWWHEGTPHPFTFKYLTDKSGSIRETDVIGPNHSLRRAKFNANGYTEREVYNEGRPNQTNVNYNRDSNTNNLKDITVTCAGKNQTRRLKAPVGPAQSGELETQELISICAKQSR